MADEDWNKNPVATTAPVIVFAVLAGIIFCVGVFVFCKWVLWPRYMTRHRGKDPRIIDLELQLQRLPHTTPGQRHMNSLQADYAAHRARGPRKAPPCRPFPPTPTTTRAQPRPREHHQQRQWPRAPNQQQQQQQHHQQQQHPGLATQTAPQQQTSRTPAPNPPPVRTPSPAESDVSDVSSGSASSSQVSDDSVTQAAVSNLLPPSATSNPCHWSPAPRTRGPEPAPRHAPPPHQARPPSPPHPNLATLFRPNNY